MSDPTSASGPSSLASTPSWRRARILFGNVAINLVCGAAALMGLALLRAGLDALLTGDHSVASAVLVSMLGAVFAAVGLGFFYFTYVAAPRIAVREEAQAARHPGEPWMLRADWAARKIVDRSSFAAMAFLWIWTASWWGVTAFLWTVNYDKIIAAVSASWGDTVLAGLLPLAGLIGLLAAVGVTRTWLRYGAATLRIDTLPGFLGDHFRGSVAARFAALPKGPLEAEIACERVTWRRVRDSDSTFKREYRVATVWSQTHMIDPGRLMLSRDGVQIPVDVPLPIDQPGCALDEDGAGIQWRLHVRAHEDSGTQFTAQFEVPVYRRG